MKKIFFSVIALNIISQIGIAQQLTKAVHEPVLNDSYITNTFDSTGIVPKVNGSGVVWDFSQFIKNSTSFQTALFANPTSGEQSGYPGVTLANKINGGIMATAESEYYKSTSNSFEKLGSATMPLQYKYNPPIVIANWPVMMGSSLISVYSGTTSGVMSGVSSGTMITEASGTGTVITPGGIAYSNVLQVKLKNKEVFTMSSPNTTFTVTQTEYRYYLSNKKFPLVVVTYSNNTFQNSKTVQIKMDTSAFVGINERSFEVEFEFFPNPASRSITVKLDNPKNEKCMLAIRNGLGQIIEIIYLGNDPKIDQQISIVNLETGVYFLTVTSGVRSSTRSFVVE